MKGCHKGKWEEQKWQAFGLALGCAYEPDPTLLLLRNLPFVSETQAAAVSQGRSLLPFPRR